MALHEKKARAVKMRKSGASYSKIKDELKVSKSTLSLWLRSMPLPEKRIRELRDFNAVRIEKYRETRRKTREDRWKIVRARVVREIGTLSKRELLLSGLFLYWGEGSKTQWCTTSLSNTDPAMVLFFIKWLEVLGVSRKDLRIHLHLYADMKAQAEIRYWAKTLRLPVSAFRKPYIKSSNRSGLSYPQKFTHGTCNVIYEDRDISEYVLQSMEHLRSLFADKKSV